MNPQRNVTSLRQELLLSLHVPSAADMHSTPNWVEDDILLPPQFFQSADRTHKMRGEVALLYAMLDDAVSCLQKGQLSRGHCVQRLAADAELWFFTDDYLSPFSFVNVCSLLGLDPAYLRSGLQQWRHQLQPRPQKKRRRTQVTRTPELAVRVARDICDDDSRQRIGHHGTDPIGSRGSHGLRADPGCATYTGSVRGLHPFPCLPYTRFGAWASTCCHR